MAGKRSDDPPESTGSMPAILQFDLQDFAFDMEGLPASACIFVCKPDTLLNLIGLEAAIASLTNAEKARSETYHFEIDRRAYIASHLLLRSTVAAVMAPLPQTARDGAHKMLRHPNARKKLWTSLSRRRGLVAVAISAEGTIGVDVEEIVTLRNPASVLEAFLDEPTLRAAMVRIETGDTRHFARCWTLIEAFTKASGEGLVAGMPKLRIENSGNGYRVGNALFAREAACALADDRHVIAAAWTERSPGAS